MWSEGPMEDWKFHPRGLGKRQAGLLCDISKKKTNTTKFIVRRSKPEQVCDTATEMYTEDKPERLGT